jgi:pentatricopeptide repeat protein
MMDYYERLEVAELEGDLFKAVKAGNLEKVKKYYKKLSAAKVELNELVTKTQK